MEILHPEFKRKLKIAGLSLVGLQVATVQYTDLNPAHALFGEAFASDPAAMDTSPGPIIETEMNNISRQMMQDVAPYERVDPESAYRDAKSTGEPFGHLFGAQLTVEDTMRYYYIAGFRGEDLKIMTAIAGKESDYFPGAFGDIDWVHDGDRSVGLSGMYCSPNGPIGCEGARNWKDNLDPLTNARNAFVLYRQAYNSNGHGTGEFGLDGRFRPWESDPEGTEARYDTAEHAYNNLQAQYGSLN